jgi:hypothetical protein
MSQQAFKRQEQAAPRFDRADWALKYAYRAEAMQARYGAVRLFNSADDQPLDDFQMFMRHVRAGMTEDEVMADGIMLKNTICRYLDQQCGRLPMLTIGAKYRVPADTFLQYLKQGDYESLAGEIKEINRSLGSRRFVVDAIRGIMEGPDRMLHTVEHWARHLSVSDKTVYRWIGSREPGYKSIRFLLGQWEEEAMFHISRKLVEMGQM